MNRPNKNQTILLIFNLVIPTIETQQKNKISCVCPSFLFTMNNVKNIFRTFVQKSFGKHLKNGV
jgi:hypothetical protein